MKAKRILVAVMAMAMSAGGFIACNDDDGEENIPVTSVEISNVPSGAMNLVIGDTFDLEATVLPENATNKSVNWTSGSPDLVSVVDGTIEALGVTPVGGILVTVKSDENGKVKASCLVHVTATVVPVEGISFAAGELELMIDDPATAAPAIVWDPVTATNQNVTWSSDEKTIATVDEYGRVSPVGVGATVITATTEDGGFTDSFDVIVAGYPVTGIELSATEMSLLNVDDTETLTITWTPENATNKNVDWESSVPGVATVVDGVVTAVSNGTTVITATTEDGDFVKICEVTVGPVAVIGISFEGIVDNKVDLVVDDEYPVPTIVWNPSNASDKTVAWSSSEPTIASVDAEGKVTALLQGTTVITATTTDGAKTASYTVNVSNKTATGVTLSLNMAADSTIKVGAGAKYAAVVTVTPAEGVANTVWSSDNDAAVTVNSATGEILAVTAGSAKITATPEVGTAVSYNVTVDGALGAGEIEVLATTDLVELAKGAVDGSIFYFAPGQDYSYGTVTFPAAVTLRGAATGARSVIKLSNAWKVGAMDKPDGDFIIEDLDFLPATDANVNMVFDNGSVAITLKSFQAIRCNFGQTDLRFKRSMFSTGGTYNGGTYGSIIVEDCIFNGFYDNGGYNIIGVGTNYPVGTVILKNSTFNTNTNNVLGFHNLTTPITAVIEGCTFYNIKNNQHLFRFEKSPEANVTIKDCLFAKSRDAATIRTINFPTTTIKAVDGVTDSITVVSTVTTSYLNNYRTNDFIINETPAAVACKVPMTLIDKPSLDVPDPAQIGIFSDPAATGGLLMIKDVTVPNNVGDPRGRMNP